jgi:hypothetical protein
MEILKGISMERRRLSALAIPRRIDIDAAAYAVRLASAGKTITGAEAATNSKYARQLSSAGLTSSKIEFGLLGWAVQAANLLKFFSGSCTETGTNTHNVAGKVTTGAAGAILTGLIPNTTGFQGAGFYKVNTSPSATARIDMAAVQAGRVVCVIANYNSTYYACYAGPQSTEQVTGTGINPAGLFLAARSSTTGQRFSRTTSGGTSTINNAAISGSGLLPTCEVPLGSYNSDGTHMLFSQSEYAFWVYLKTQLTTTERDTLIDIFIAWLLDLGWIT